jgi:putative membrane protein
MRLTHRLALAAMLAGGAAFAQTGTPPGSSSSAAAMSTTAVRMSPSAVLSMIHQVNQDEIRIGRLAQSKAQNDEVKGFAKDMVDDHTALDKKLTDFVQTEGKGRVTLSATKIPAAKHQELKAMTHDTERKLGAATGANFDREYMSAMLKGHDSVLSNLNAALPSLKGQDKVYDLVSSARDKVKDHRDRASNIMEDLERNAATGGSGMQGTSASTGTTSSPNKPRTSAETGQ